MNFILSSLLLLAPLWASAQTFTGTYVACGEHELASIKTLRFERQLDQSCASDRCAKSILVLRPDSGRYNLSYTVENLGCPRPENAPKLSLDATYLKAYGGHWEQAEDRVQLYILDTEEPFYFTLREEGETLVLERMPQPPAP